MIEYYDIRLDTQRGPIGLISEAERNLLRKLAARVAELASDPIQEEKKKLWKMHNSLKRVRPMVLTFPEGAWTEILPYKSMLIEDPFWRSYEWYLKRLVYRGENIRDDNVIEPVVDVPLVYSTSSWGLDLQYKDTSVEKGAWGFDAVLKELSDAEKIKSPKIYSDEMTTKRNEEAVGEILGDLLNVRQYRHIPLDKCLITILTRMRGMEQLMLDMYDNPEWLHSVMQKLQSGTLNLMSQLESEIGLELNNGNDYVGSGGLAFTDELPVGMEGSKVRFDDLWGFAASQEYTNVSPSMFYEFALQYQIPLLEKYGLNCYGCCERIDDKFDIIKKVPNLRRVSVSPWTDIHKAAEALEDKYICSCKPNPAILADSYDHEEVKRSIKGIMDAAGKCVLEIIMKDTHTVGNDPERIIRWVDTAKAEAEI